MRKLRKLMTLAMAGILLITSASRVHAQDVTVSYQTFYDNLAPYGQWINDPQYGNVWVPNEGGDFRPYGTRGHWVMTDYGNTWVSDDPWGWACYHYGRWTYNPYYGWVWVPGYEWAPAWVSWRYGGGQCGWAPMGPGVEIGATYNCPDSWWVFVGPQYMYRPDCIHYWGGPGYNATYIHQTTFINNYYRDNGTSVRYNYGPRPEQIQAVTHQPVQVYHVTQSNRPGAPSMGGHSISMYRPAVNRATVNTARPANVIQAPHAIGRPQAATNVSAAHAPAFHTAIQSNPSQFHAAATNGGGHQPAGGPMNRGNQPAPQRNQPAPQRNQPAPQQHNQPMSQHNQPQQRPQPMPQQHNQPMQRPQPMPQQHNQPMPQSRPQPMPQQHNQPAPQQRPQPMPQQHAPAPQPHMAPAPHEAPREEGGRR